MNADTADLLAALKQLLEHARISFPRTPYRDALENARTVVARIEGQGGPTT